MTEGNVEVSSLEVVEFDVVDEGLFPQGPRARVVDVKDSGPSVDTITVIVKGDGVNPKSPPRTLNKMMLEHGYAYIDWAATSNDATFEYAPVV